jgi:hypothetical protein
MIDQHQLKEDVKAIIESRIATAGSNKSLTSKFAYELGRFADDDLMAFFAEKGFGARPFKELSIYALQKFRKIAAYSIGKVTSIDPYTIAILKNAVDLDKAGVAFTPDLQVAALSTAFEVKDSDRVVKLKHRQRYSEGTAKSQSQTSRNALVELGMARKEKVTGNGYTLMVDLEHPIVRRVLGLAPIEPAVAEPEFVTEFDNMEEVEAAA